MRRFVNFGEVRFAAFVSALENFAGNIGKMLLGAVVRLFCQTNYFRTRDALPFHKISRNRAFFDRFFCFSLAVFFFVHFYPEIKNIS